MAPEKLALLARSAVRRFKVRSAFTPMLYLCMVAIPAFLAATKWEQDATIRLILICAAVAVAGAGITAYFYFAVKHPKMLQSEDYQLRQESLEIVREKSGMVIVDVSGIERIATSRGNLIDRGGEE